MGNNLFAATLDSTTADHASSRPKAVIAHPLRMGVEIMDGFPGKFARSRQGFTGGDHLFHLTLPQGLFDPFQPVASIWALRKSGIGDNFEMFFGMIPIHNLDGVGVILGDQVPNPNRSISQEDQFWAQVGFEMTASGP